jgi:hypothetical protein
VGTWTFPPCSWAFPEYHRLIFPFHTHGFLATPVSGEDLPIQDHIRHPVSLGLLQGVMQIWCLVGEHADDLIEVPVTRGTGDAVVPRQRGDPDILAEPTQPQRRLPKAGHCPAVLANTTLAAFDMQQAAEVLGKFAWHVEHGTIGNHGEPLVVGLDLRKSSPTRSSPPTSHRCHQPAGAPTPRLRPLSFPANKLILLRSPQCTRLGDCCWWVRELSVVTGRLNVCSMMVSGYLQRWLTWNVRMLNLLR